MICPRYGGRNGKREKTPKRTVYYALNLALCQHLFSQMLLVFANTAVPSMDSLPFAYHDVLGNLIEKSVVYGRLVVTGEH